MMTVAFNCEWEHLSSDLCLRRDQLKTTVELAQVQRSRLKHAKATQTFKYKNVETPARLLMWRCVFALDKWKQQTHMCKRRCVQSGAKSRCSWDFCFKLMLKGHSTKRITNQIHTLSNNKYCTSNTYFCIFLVFFNDCRFIYFQFSNFFFLQIKLNLTWPALHLHFILKCV